MEEEEFNYNPLMYPIAVLGFITGNVIDSRFTDFPWLPWVIYAFAFLMLVAALIRHRTIFVNENEIRVKELIKGETVIPKKDVHYYRTTYDFRKTPFTTWYFIMKSGEEIIVTHDYMQGEKSIQDTINNWCSSLPVEPSA